MNRSRKAPTNTSPSARASVSQALRRLIGPAYSAASSISSPRKFTKVPVGSDTTTSTMPSPMLVPSMKPT